MAGTLPALSILMPTYNGARYLAEQLDSILAQTWRDFELIIVDDGSTDATPALLEDYASRDARIRHQPSQGNRGQKVRLIQLLQAARAPLISIADQDDVWDASKTERLHGSIGNAALAFGRSELIDGEGNRLERSLLEVNRADPRPGDRVGILVRPQVSGHAMLARRDVVCEDMFRSAEPYDWLISLAAQFSRGIVYDPEAIVYHRIHGSNSHNGAVGLRLNPLTLRPHHLVEALRRASSRRHRFVRGLDLLASSAVVPEEDRRTFDRLGKLCAAAWNEGDRRPAGSRGHLRKTILESLKPFAGSERDWRILVDHVTAYAMGLSHPTTLCRLNRLL